MLLLLKQTLEVAFCSYLSKPVALYNSNVQSCLIDIDRNLWLTDYQDYWQAACCFSFPVVFFCSCKYIGGSVFCWLSHSFGSHSVFWNTWRSYFSFSLKASDIGFVYKLQYLVSLHLWLVFFMSYKWECLFIPLVKIGLISDTSRLQLCYLYI